MTRTIAIAIGVLAFAAIAPPAGAANSGLVGHWQLNDGAGAIAADSSGFGDNGALSGGVSWVVTPQATALQFDGSTGQVTIPDAPQLEPTTAVSVTAWIARSGSPGDYRYVVSKGATDCTAASYGLYSGPNGGLQFYVSRNHGTAYARSPDAGTAVWNGNWHLVVGTFDGSTIRLYVDGTEVGSGTSYPGQLDYQLLDGNALYIGDYPGCSRKNFQGDISGVEIWNRALSPAEIQAMAQPPNQPVLPPPNPSTPGAGTSTTSGGSTNGSGTTGAGTSGSPTTDQGPAFLSGLALTRSNFTTRGIRTLTISYNDLRGVPVKLTLLKLENGRCRLGRKGARSRCARYVRIGSFMRFGRAGRNSLGLPTQWRNLKAGRYRLVVADTAGHSVTVAFRVVR